MKKLIFLILFTFVFGLSGCSRIEEINGFSMDAPYSIKITNPKKEQKEEVKKILNKSDSVFSAYKDSFLYELNENKYLEKNDENKDLFEAIKLSLPYCGDFFDISIRQYTKLWDFKSDAPVPPLETALKEAVSGFNNIKLTENTITLENNTELDLGAVAKGYICDKVYDVLKGNDGIIDIGGTIKSTCQKPVTVGIRNPDGGTFLDFYINKGEAVATSGIYERSFTYNGALYHHILNPKTGNPAFNNLKSVTVVSDSGIKSDILSTLYFVEGETAEIPDDISVIFITKDNEIIKKGKKLTHK